MNFLKKIKKNSFFEMFSDEEINRLFDCLKGKIVLKSKGMLIAKKDTIIKEFCIVMQGTLLEFNIKPNGEREPITTLSEGEMFGICQGYLTNSKLGYFIVAATDVSLLYLDIASITTMCDKACPCHQNLIFNVMSYLCDKIEDLQKNKNYITLKGMRYKISTFLYNKYLDQNSSVIILGMDRNQMATYLNVSRPSMSREMMKMRDENIIEFWKDKITIKDMQALEKIIKT